MTTWRIGVPLLPGWWAEAQGDRRWVMAIRIRPNVLLAEAAVPEEPAWAASWRAWVAAWQEGRMLPALPLAPAPSPFAAAVRAALLAIPCGEVRTYGELAAGMGRPGAARAVARACATNPLPLVVPCHRVVARTGPGGYSATGGVSLKLGLLAHEGVAWPPPKLRPKRPVPRDRC